MVDFYSKFELITKGACRDIVWHQYKNQYFLIYSIGLQLFVLLIKMDNRLRFKKVSRKKESLANLQKKSICDIISENHSKKY